MIDVFFVKWRNAMLVLSKKVLFNRILKLCTNGLLITTLMKRWNSRPATLQWIAPKNPISGICCPVFHWLQQDRREEQSLRQGQLCGVPSLVTGTKRKIQRLRERSFFVNGRELFNAIQRITIQSTKHDKWKSPRLQKRTGHVSGDCCGWATLRPATPHSVRLDTNSRCYLFAISELD